MAAVKERSEKKVTNEEWLAASFYQMPAAWRSQGTDANGNPVGRRRYGTAAFKFTDTTFGGSDVVNPRHQYCKYSDPPVKGIYAASQGVGEWWSSTIDEYKQKVHIGPGIPSFNSSMGFLRNYYEAETGHLVNTGRGSSLSFQVGKVVGTGATVVAGAAVVSTVGAVPAALVAGTVYGFGLTKKIYNYLSESPSSKYYHLKATPELYWNAVSNIMNTISVYMGFVGKPDIPGTARIESGNIFYSPEEASLLAKYMPDIFRSDGSIDVYRLSRKAQILQDTSRENIQRVFEAGGVKDFDTRGSSRALINRLEKYLDNKLRVTEPTTGNPSNYVEVLSGNIESRINESVSDKDDSTGTTLISSVRTEENLMGLNGFLQEYLESQLGVTEPTVKGPPEPQPEGSNVISTTGGNMPDTVPDAPPQPPAGGGESAVPPDGQAASTAQGWLAQAAESGKSVFNGFENARDFFAQAKASVASAIGAAKDFGVAQSRGGGDFVTYHVDYAGPVQESFSNSTTNSEIEGGINGAVRGSRNTRFSLSDGNVGDGAIAGVIEGVVSTVTGMAAGVAASFGMDGLIAMTGRGFADIPKHWDSSSANLPTMSYSLELRAVYGHRFDILMNIMYPLATLLAFVLPRSTGKQSYSSPFLVRCFDKGRAVCRLGIMKDLSITRGEGNVAWNDDLLPLSVNVNFSIEDLSSVMHMPIAPMVSFGEVLTMGAGAAIGGAGGFVANGGVPGAATDIMSGNGDQIAASVSSGANKGKHISNLMTGGNWDDDNAFTDYMSGLTALDITDMIYASNRMKLRMAQRVTAFNTQTSASYLGNQFNSTVPGRVMQALANQGMYSD